MHVGINAHLLSFAASYRGAGISRYIRSLISHLRQSGNGQYTVFLGDPNFPQEFSPNTSFHLNISRLPTVNPMVRILWEQLLLPVELASSDIDILHSMGYVQPVACLRRSIVTVHDLSFVLFPEMFNRLNRLYLTMLTRLSVRRANRVIAVSENTKRDLTRLFGVASEKIDVVYHGVEERFCPATGAELAAFRLDRNLPERYILFIGTLEPRKNVHTLIKAFAKVRKAGLPHKLVIGGAKGWLWSEIFSMVSEMGLEREVIFPGYISLENEPLWYNGADLFVYPSLYEGFGFPLLEAMACGTPVVTSNSSSLPEVVGEAGLLVDPSSGDDLAEAMLTVLTDRALSDDMKKKGLERARSFSWAEAAGKTAQIYQSCLSAR
ncbi:MAG: glycosyltransferase family 4 protein [Chloroflexi bacterium]|nr:glycosyltransferase family 4 protein [Chloroflexota bacterium]